MTRFRPGEYATWLSFLIMAGVIVLFLSLLGSMSGATPEDRATAMRDAIERAVVQCYALEGAYPPDISYLERYGIHIDPLELTVNYRAYGANIRPDIFVDVAFDPSEEGMIFDDALEITLD